MPIQPLTRIFALLLLSNPVAAQDPCISSNPGYTIPAKEVNCFQFFDYNQSPGVNAANNYLLSTISQMMYTERLDFEMRRLKNPSSFPGANFRSTQLNSSSNASFECDFKKRFSHWFYDINAEPRRPNALSQHVSINTDMVKTNNVTDRITPVQTKSPVTLQAKSPVTLQGNTPELKGGAPIATPPRTNGPTSEEKFLADSIAFEKSKPQFKFLNKRQDFVNIANAIRIPGFDPELMVVSTEKYIIIAWRGTDNVYKDDAWEWVGTDFYFNLQDGDGPLAGAKMHAGIWNSFKIIRDKLISTLNAFEAKTRNKKIFITGHSLGGGMALVSAPYLAGLGYKIGDVYTYAAPRTVGDQAFVNKCNSLLGSGRIQRFEYGVDFVTKLWSPALFFSQYKIPGHRHWLNAQGSDDDYDCDERRYPMTLNPAEYMTTDRKQIDKLNGDIGGPDAIARYILVGGLFSNSSAERPKDIRGFMLMDFGQHNPTYYTKKAYENLSTTLKSKLPTFQHTYPYVLPGVAGNK